MSSTYLSSSPYPPLPSLRHSRMFLPRHNSLQDPDSPSSDNLCFPQHKLDFNMAAKSLSLPLPSISRKGKLPASARHISAYTPLLVPLILFPLTTALTLTAITSLPLPSPLPTSPTPKSVYIIASSLSKYSAPSSISLDSWTTIVPTAHLLLVLSIVAIWKHAWSVPGAILLNVLAGSIWGGVAGVLVMTPLTAIGSVGSTVISRSLSQWFEGVMPRAIQVTRNALDSNNSDDPAHAHNAAPWMRLALLRLIGIVPWSGLNIASGIVRVPLLDCFVGALIGCLPWTVVTCQMGDILNSLATGLSAEDSERTVTDILTTWDVLLKLAALTTLSLLPIFAKSAFKRFLTSSPPSEVSSATQSDDELDEKHIRKSRWSWSHSSRPSRSSSKGGSVDAEKHELMERS